MSEPTADAGRTSAATPARIALERVAAAVNFRSAAEDELDEAIVAARRAGCADKDIAPVLGQTAEAIRQRRVRIAGRRLSAEPEEPDA